MRITEERFRVARIQLSGLVLDQAQQHAEKRGLPWPGYRAVAHDAPEALYQIRAAMRAAQSGRRLFPVWEGASDKTIYTFPSINHAFRFWHDCLHLDTQGTTELADELRIGYAHAEIVARQFGAGSVEHVLMLADTVGQSMYHAQHGKFPDDQLAFARAHFKFEVGNETHQ